MNQQNKVLVVIEPTPGKSILPASLECAAAGRRLCQEMGGELLALVMGHNVSRIAEEMSGYDVDAVYMADHPLLNTYQPEVFTAALNQVVGKINPKAILMGDTLFSIDFAPRIAFSLNTGLITDCVGFEFEEEQALFIKPVYSSNVMAAFGFVTEPYVITMRSRVMKAIPKNSSAAEIVLMEVDLNPSIARSEIIERALDEEEGPKLISADIIVAGGRGMAGPEGFQQIAELAKILGGAVGASRPPCDLGWISPKAQVGQTGEKVGPSVYIAVGISGATQHIAGMSSAGKIIAINKDSNANIFKIADYGVVGRHEEILPAFKAELLEIMK
jgi:electron transfer flavoprotein alpha subunit